MGKWVWRGSVLAALAVVVGWSVYAGVRPRDADRAATASVAPAVASTTVSSNEELATCPVTGDTKRKSEMTPYEYQGRTYYLCCVPDCLDKIKADPDKYLTLAATAVAKDESEYATCPVTGETKLKSQMSPYAYKGHTYYLCCVPAGDCLEKVKQYPDKYLKEPDGSEE